jgi:asparaginyl-tRNA synthetase
MFDRPVFVYHYPTAIKAFYMQPVEDRPEVCRSVDLLAPEGYGEITGGSERIYDAALLDRRIREIGISPENYAWYLGLRRYGSVPHAGFGLGVERTVAWMCGLPHIRETIPYARMLNRLYP